MRYLVLKWPANCADCGAKLPAGEQVRYYGKHSIYCLGPQHKKEHGPEKETRDLGAEAMEAGSLEFPQGDFSPA